MRPLITRMISRTNVENVTRSGRTLIAQGVVFTVMHLIGIWQLTCIKG